MRFSGKIKLLILLPFLFLAYQNFITSYYLKSNDLTFKLSILAMAVYIASINMKRFHSQGAAPKIYWILLAFFVYVSATVLQSTFLWQVSLLFLLYILLPLSGLISKEALRFPLFFILLSNEPYYFLYKISPILKVISSQISAFFLYLGGIKVIVQGVILHLPRFTLEVNDTCSGINGLWIFFIVSVFLSYLFQKNNINRVILIASSILASIVANSLRIALSGLIAVNLGKTGFDRFHIISGEFVYITGVVLIVLLNYALLTIRWDGE